MKRLSLMLATATVLSISFVEAIQLADGRYKVAGASGVRVKNGTAEMLPPLTVHSEYSEPFNPVAFGADK